MQCSLFCYDFSSMTGQTTNKCNVLSRYTIIKHISLYQDNNALVLPSQEDRALVRARSFSISWDGLGYAVVTNNAKISVDHQKSFIYHCALCPSWVTSAPCHHCSHSTTHYLDQRLANLEARTDHLFLHGQWAKNTFKNFFSGWVKKKKYAAETIWCLQTSK